jgi:hypothetical protein
VKLNWNKSLILALFLTAACNEKSENSQAANKTTAAKSTAKKTKAKKAVASTPSAATKGNANILTANVSKLRLETPNMNTALEGRTPYLAYVFTDDNNKLHYQYRSFIAHVYSGSQVDCEVAARVGLKPIFSAPGNFLEKQGDWVSEFYVVDRRDSEAPLPKVHLENPSIDSDGNRIETFSFSNNENVWACLEFIPIKASQQNNPPMQLPLDSFYVQVPAHVEY